MNDEDKVYRDKIDREIFIDWLNENHNDVEFVLHIGAHTDTTEFDKRVFNDLNLNYSKEVWELCVKHGLPLIYASSAAT